MNIGDLIDNLYKITAKIGEGSQGDVYKVQHIANKKQIALKIINLNDKSEKQKKEIIHNLKEEFKLINKVKHENIINVYNFGFDSNHNLYYYTMEYLDGLNLSDFMHKYYNEKNFAQITYQILRGLDLLHSNDIIHFDIKPENILIVKNAGGFTAKILDFGLSELKKDDKLTTISENKIKGTLFYIAPEIFFHPSKASYKADLYSLGISLIHSLIKENLIKQSVSKAISLEDFDYTLNFLSNKNRDFLGKIKNLKVNQFISKLVEPNPEIRISSTKEAISFLNFLFKSKFEIPNDVKTKSFEKNSRFIVRENTIDQLKSVYFSFRKEDSAMAPNAIALIGESGSGKSKVLEKLYYDLSLDLHPILKLNIQENSEYAYKIETPILKHIPRLLGNKQKFHSEYEKLLKKIELVKNQNSPLTFLEINDRIISFINKITEKKSLLILLDGYHKLSNESMQFVLRMIDNTKANKNLFYILALDNSTVETTESVKNINIKFLLTDTNVKNITLRKLCKTEIEEIQESLIGEIANLPKNYYNDLLKYSEGNFRKIMKFLDIFFHENLIKSLADKYIFTNKELFKNILQRDSKTLLQNTFHSFENEEKEILSLLSISFKKLSEEEIVNLTQITPYKCGKIIKKMKSGSLIDTSFLDNKLKYIISRLEIKEICADHLSVSKKKFYLKQIMKLDSSDNLEKTITDFLDLLLVSVKDKKTIAKIEILESFYNKIKFFDKSNSMAFLFEIIIPLLPNINYQFFFILKNINLLRTRDISGLRSAIKLIEKLESEEFKQVKNPTLIIDFIWTKLLCYSKDIYDFDFVEYFRKNRDYLYENMSMKKFHANFFDLLDTYISKYPSKLEKIKDLIRVVREIPIDKADRICIESKILLHVKEIESAIIPWDDSYITVLKDYLKDFEDKNIINDNYFKLLSSYITLCNNNWYKDGLEKTILSGIKYAYHANNIKYLVKILYLGSDFYFLRRNFQKSLELLNKMLDIRKKTFYDISKYDVIGSILACKHSLYYPYEKIQTLLNAVKSESKVRGDILLHFDNLTNEVIIQFKFGNFIQAQSSLIECLNFFENVSEEAIEKMFKIISVYLPAFMEKAEIYELIGIQFANNILSEVLTKSLFKRLEKVYKHKVPFRWACGYHDNILNGVLQEETPVAVMAYIKKNKNLPEASKVMGKIPNIFRDETYIGHALVLNVTYYIFTKNEELLEKIKILAKKLATRRYLIQLYYTMTPLIEFMILSKMLNSYLSEFIDLLLKTEEMLKINFDNKHKKLWEQSTFHQDLHSAIKHYNKISSKE